MSRYFTDLDLRAFRARRGSKRKRELEPAVAEFRCRSVDEIWVILSVACFLYFFPFIITWLLISVTKRFSWKVAQRFAKVALKDFFALLEHYSRLQRMTCCNYYPFDWSKWLNRYFEYKNGSQRLKVNFCIQIIPSHYMSKVRIFLSISSLLNHSLYSEKFHWPNIIARLHIIQIFLR